MEVNRISLIIAGGVSLGAYEAGVLTELLYALEQLNLSRDDDPIVIDVMTGCSAGSITAAMVGRILLHDAGQRGILHEAWVERADVDTMMAQPNPARARCSATPCRRNWGRNT